MKEAPILCVPLQWLTLCPKNVNRAAVVCSLCWSNITSIVDCLQILTLEISGGWIDTILRVLNNFWVYSCMTIQTHSSWALCRIGWFIPLFPFFSIAHSYSSLLEYLAVHIQCRVIVIMVIIVNFAFITSSPESGNSILDMHVWPYFSPVRL